MGYCRLLEGYTCLKTPIVIHSCNHFERSSNFLLPTVQQILKNIFNFQFCHYKARKNLKNILDTSSCLRGTHILEHCTCFTYLGGQPNFYNQRFARYGFWAILGLFLLIFVPKNGFRLPFSLITKSILKINLLTIPKQLLFYILQ